MLKKHLITTIGLLCIAGCMAQETINVNDPSSYVLGGDTGFNTATIEVNPIAITDLEPDTGNIISFIIDTEGLEAGTSAMGEDGLLTNEDAWLNFTYRGANNENAQILVYANQPVPAGIEIKIEIIATASVGGNFVPNPNTAPIILDTTEQILVNDFPNGYTGDGIGTGYQLRYTIGNPNGEALPTGFEIIYEIR